MVAVLAVGLVAGGLFTWSHLKKRKKAEAVAAAWAEYNGALRKGDLGAIREALDGVLAASPDDPGATRFKAILAAGAADPDTPELAAVLLRHHLAGGRVPEASREAEVILARFPKHWLARCVQIHHAAQFQDDRGRAEQLLADLPDPEDPAAAVDASGVLYALHLFEGVGRDSTALRRVIVRRLAPILRGGAAATAPAAAKVQLVQCYLAPFADADAFGELAAHWGAADKLAEDAVAEAVAAGDVPVLVSLGELGPRMRAALRLLRQYDPGRLPDDRLGPLLKAVDDRTRRAWEAVREKTPADPAAYRGLAFLALQEHKPDEALGQLLAGVAACGDRAELLELIIQLSAQFKTDERTRALAGDMWKAAEGAKTDPAKWCLAAMALDAVQRRDGVLAAVRKAREIQPNHPWACATEARVWLRTGDALKAAEALAPLGAAALRANPGLAQLHARVLVGTGRWVLVDDEYKAILEAAGSRKPRATGPAVGFLLGVVETPPDVVRAAWVDFRVGQLLEENPDAPLAPQLRVEARYRLAELSATPHPKNDGTPPVWDAGKVEAALRAIGELPDAARAEPGILAATAALQLKGQRDAAAALRTAAPLVAAEDALNPFQLEVLGAVLTANGRPADAVRVLERAVRSPGAAAGAWAALALAYRANKQPDDAAAALRQVLNIPDRSAREQAEYVAAKLLLQRETP